MKDSRKVRKNTKLYFLVDSSFARGNQVYSGHSGTGKKFKMFMSDYGKYAMTPTTKTACKDLIKKIEKDAKGKNNNKINFQWNIVPMTEIDLCNFYEQAHYDAYQKLKEEQLKLK
jgi:hypothetical protein